MEAKELMIGDWVYNNPSYFNDDYNGVTEFPDELQLYRIERGEDLEETGSYSPIPLTAEILEKNGFRVDGSGTNSRMCCTPFEEPGIRYNIYVGLKYKTIDVFAAHPEERKKGWRKSNKVYLEISGPFVHELQHALRLCGIDKEIVL